MVWHEHYVKKVEVSMSDGPPVSPGRLLR
jgi:hypothetical protein